MNDEVKVNRMELVGKIRELIAARSHDPADELIVIGKALMDIGKVLKGQSPAEARAILAAVQALEAA